MVTNDNIQRAARRRDGGDAEIPIQGDLVAAGGVNKLNLHADNIVRSSFAL